MPKIEEMFAFIAVDLGPDDEGLLADFNFGMWFPLVGADMERMNYLKFRAKMIAKNTGHIVKLVRFTHREELETIRP